MVLLVSNRNISSKANNFFLSNELSIYLENILKTLDPRGVQTRVVSLPEPIV